MALYPWYYMYTRKKKRYQVWGRKKRKMRRGKNVEKQQARGKKKSLHVLIRGEAGRTHNPHIYIPILLYQSVSRYVFPYRGCSWFWIVRPLVILQLCAATVYGPVLRAFMAWRREDPATYGAGPARLKKHTAVRTAPAPRDGTQAAAEVHRLFSFVMHLASS